MQSKGDRRGYILGIFPMYKQGVLMSNTTLRWCGELHKLVSNSDWYPDGQCQV